LECFAKLEEQCENRWSSSGFCDRKAVKASGIKTLIYGQMPFNLQIWKRERIVTKSGVMASIELSDFLY
jgi:hypothetical protein